LVIDVEVLVNPSCFVRGTGSAFDRVETKE